MTNTIFFDPNDTSHNSSAVKFNPLAMAKENADFIVEFLGRMPGVKLSESKKKVLLSIVESLPDGASMHTLLDAIKAQEAAELGITVEQYDALGPLFEALQVMCSRSSAAAAGILPL